MTIRINNKVIAGDGGKNPPDQTYNPTSTNAQSGTAVAEAVSTKQNTLVSGTNIKTINGNSILGEGDLSVSAEVTESDIIDALGYTPYDSNNPNGYTNNVGTVTSVNNTPPDASGNVTISVTGGANTDLSNLTATGEVHFLKNTATGTDSLIIGGNDIGSNNSVSIGIGSTVDGAESIAIGTNAFVGGGESIAIGTNAVSDAPYTAIQLGGGVNSTPFTFNVGFGPGPDPTTYINYQLLDGTTGLIPDARIQKAIQSRKTTSSTISLDRSTVIYEFTPTDTSEISFDLGNLNISDNETLTFELKINMTSICTVTFPNTVKWLDEEIPEMDEVGIYYFVFRTDDKGNTWIANLQGLFK